MELICAIGRRLLHGCRTSGYTPASLPAEARPTRRSCSCEGRNEDRLRFHDIIGSESRLGRFKRQQMYTGIPADFDAAEVERKTYRTV